MASKTHSFTDRQRMSRSTFEVYHYRDENVKKLRCTTMIFTRSISSSPEISAIISNPAATGSAPAMCC